MEQRFHLLYKQVLQTQQHLLRIPPPQTKPEYTEAKSTLDAFIQTQSVVDKMRPT